MYIRLATTQDLDTIAAIYAYAREQMKRHHNPHQWGDHHPALALLRDDLARQQLYLICEQATICGVFAFILGEDPTYRSIEAGSWRSNSPYGTIHRIAAAPNAHGIFATALAYCETQIDHLRIDTHADNHIMQHAIEKAGFERCGIIYTDDGTPRIAYQKLLSQTGIPTQRSDS